MSYAVVDIETTLDHKTIHGAGITLVRDGQVTDSKWCDSVQSLASMLGGVTHVVGPNIIGFDLPVPSEVWGTWKTCLANPVLWHMNPKTA